MDRSGQRRPYQSRLSQHAELALSHTSQPTKFELILNLKTAKALSVDLPTSILLRADGVIE
jgi:putative ABC transport system substrate-binding protein